MKKRILIISLLITFFGVFIFSLVMSEVYYKKSLTVSEAHLKVYMNGFNNDIPLNTEGANEFSDKLGGLRVTFISVDGNVIADSEGQTQDNHIDRKEIREALSTGEGFAVRKSKTVNKNLLYYCKKFDNFLVRISIETPSDFSIFVDTLPTIVWFLLLDIVICLFFTYISTNYMLKPVERLAKEAIYSGKDIETKYPELRPIAAIMNNLNKEIDSKIEKIKDDKKIEALVLNNMKNGIIILKSASDIILINKMASDLREFSYKDTYIKFILRDKELSRMVDNRESGTLYRELNNREYSFQLTEAEDAMVILISDVTAIRRAEKSKNEFIANVTHEMNTPLTSIKGFSELIMSGQLSEKKIEEGAKIIRLQSEKLSNLIKSIINYSEIDNDELPDYPVNVSLLALESIEAIKPYAQQNNIELIDKISPDCIIMSRHERVKEVIDNLIANAIRYNKKDGKVFVDVINNDNIIKLIIKDTGIGISKENLPKIFDRFYTVDRSHNGLGGGFGLGLAIVKKLAIKANWKIEVKSEENIGTEITIIF